ncbi:hypothetical protein ILUMI_10267 [Ignelater luminosus]|uniref:Uncharacterized protein n=1 Tax=Ignelater luminosus TaxID=2038154 RepID=A0A8K0D3K9_IGNLU|nr:hypothetical protein ILUMI_10267 [Ignelater luminosus]
MEQQLIAEIPESVRFPYMSLRKLGLFSTNKFKARLSFRFVKEFRQAFSLILLTEFLIDGPFICAELLATFESRSFQNQLRHAMPFIFITLQLVFFCSAASYITDEAMAVSDALYFSNWYSQLFPSLKVPLLLILQNCQKEVTIKAGGLVTFNAETTIKVGAQGYMVCMFSSERVTTELNRFEALTVTTTEVLHLY